MSVVEYNLLKGKPAMRRAATENGVYADTKGRAYKRNTSRVVRTKNLCILARHLATLLRAGLPLAPAMSAIVEQLGDNPLSDIMRQVAGSVNAGSSLADALGEHPGVFSSLFVNMVAAGEASGALEEVLLRLAEMMDKRMQLANKVKSALAYPLMTAVVAVGVVVFLLSFVVPSITQVFLEMNRVLPWPTRLLISMSAFIKTYFVLIAVVVCAVLFGFRAWLRTREGRIIWDRSKLKLPLFGALFLKLEIARLTRTLGVLLVSGIPILRALEIAKGIIQNSFIANSLDSVRDRISRGDTIANAIRKTGLFPSIVFHIMATGQVSGNVEAGFIDIADMYEGEVEMTTKTLTSLLEPAILLVMGVIVGFIVLAILLPIFEINQVL